MSTFFIMVKVEAPAIEHVLNSVAAMIDNEDTWAPGYCTPISVNVQPVEETR